MLGEEMPQVAESATQTPSSSFPTLPMADVTPGSTARAPSPLEPSSRGDTPGGSAVSQLLSRLEITRGFISAPRWCSSTEGGRGRAEES